MEEKNESIKVDLVNSLCKRFWIWIFIIIISAASFGCSETPNKPATQTSEIKEPEITNQSQATTQKPSVKPKISDLAVLEEMQVNFGKDVTAVAIDDNGKGFVRIDVYTNYFPDKDVAQTASGMAGIAAQIDSVISAYPSVSVSAYVWPKNKEFYITRASASYKDGKLEKPMDTFVNDVLQ